MRTHTLSLTPLELWETGQIFRNVCISHCSSIVWQTTLSSELSKRPSKRQKEREWERKWDTERENERKRELGIESNEEEKKHQHKILLTRFRQSKSKIEYTVAEHIFFGGNNKKNWSTERGHWQLEMWMSFVIKHNSHRAHTIQCKYFHNFPFHCVYMCVTNKVRQTRTLLLIDYFMLSTRKYFYSFSFVC